MLNARWVALIEQVGTYTPELQRLRLPVREAFVDRARDQASQESGAADPGIDPVMTSQVWPVAARVNTESGLTFPVDAVINLGMASAEGAH